MITQYYFNMCNIDIVSPGLQRKIQNSLLSHGPGQPPVSSTPNKPPITSPKPKTHPSTESKSPPGAPPSPTSLYSLAQPVTPNKTDTAQTDPRENTSQPKKGLRIVPNKAYGMSNNGADDTSVYSRACYNGNSALLQIDDDYNQPVDSVSTEVSYAEPYASGAYSRPPLPRRDCVDEYSYADPLRADKWHLQKMARDIMERPNPNNAGPMKRSASLKGKMLYKYVWFFNQQLNPASLIACNLNCTLTCLLLLNV